MSKAIDNLKAAQQRAVAIRPKVGEFSVLAETFRQAVDSWPMWGEEMGYI